MHWDTGAELGGYYDSDNTAVVTPSVRARAGDSDGVWSAQGSYLVDIVSAASVDIVSTASSRWHEVRHAATLGASYGPGSAKLSAFGAASSEPDYLSLSFGGGLSHELADKSATASLQYAYERDVAGRTGTPFSVYSLRLHRHSIGAGLEIVLGPATTLTPSLDVMLENGRQEKPYRWLPLFDASVASTVPTGASVELVNRLRLPGRVAERLPEDRQRFAASLRLAHRFASSTLVLWERSYLDSWGLLATTSDARWVVDLSRRWSFWPLARFHEQSAVTFWRRAYVGEIADGRVVVPDFRTGDRELGSLWSASLGAGIAWGIGGADPKALQISLEARGIYTNFLDALYVDDRWAGFGVAGFSARLP